MARIEIEPVILGFFLLSPRHGYEVQKELTDPEGIGSVYKIKIGKLYNELNNLKDLKDLEVNVRSNSKRPPKNEYRITSKGRERFLNWIHSPLSHGRDFRVLFLCKLYFLNRIKELDFLTLIDAQIAECENWLSRYTHSSSPSDSYLWMVDSYRKSQIQSILNWLKWCKGNINP